MGKWLYLVETVCADPAREKEFQEWYDNVHVPDVLTTPGFMCGTRYMNKDRGDDEPHYLAAYEIKTDDIKKTMEALQQKVREAGERGRRSPVLGRVSRRLWRQISPAKECDPASRGGIERKEKWLHLVETVCTDPAREREFQEWYDNVHVPDVLTTPGFVRGTRYVNKDNEQDKPLYLAAYEIETDDIKKTMEALQQKVLEFGERGRRSPILGRVSRRPWRQISPTKESRHQ